MSPWHHPEKGSALVVSILTMTCLDMVRLCSRDLLT